MSERGYKFTKRVMRQFYKDLKNYGRQVAGCRLKNKCANWLKRRGYVKHEILGWIEKDFDCAQAGVTNKIIFDVKKYEKFKGRKDKLINNDEPKEFII